jgi:hypothetical protein
LTNLAAKCSKYPKKWRRLGDLRDTEEKLRRDIERARRLMGLDNVSAAIGLNTTHTNK